VLAAFCFTQRYSSLKSPACSCVSSTPQPTEWQRIGNQIDAATIFARAHFVKVLRTRHRDCSYHFVIAVWRAKEAESLHPMTKKIILSITLSGLFALTRICSAQTLTPLVHQSPGGANLAFQLTDGTVMCQSDSSNEWYKLTPDNTGSYINGTWTQLASLQPGYVPDAFASAVLADGRVVITGGEYNNDQFALTNLGAVYDPIGNTWTPLAAPPGWDFIGDSPSVVLPDGRFVVGRKLDMQVAALDPATLTWTLLGSLGKSDFNAEEGWTLLPDGTVLTFDVQNAPNSEIYNSSTQSWQSAGSTIVDLHSPSPFGCIPYGPMVITQEILSRPFCPMGTLSSRA
jgi:hypothetical protein